MTTKTVKKTRAKSVSAHHRPHRRKKRVGAPVIVKRAVAKAKELSTNDLLMIVAGAGIGGFVIPKLNDMLPSQVKPYGNYIPLGLGLLGAMKLGKNKQLQLISIGVACAGINPALKELKLISDPFISDPFINNPMMYLNGAPSELNEGAYRMIVDNYKESKQAVTGYGF
jgi:hypothetical protein